MTAQPPRATAGSRPQPDTRPAPSADAHTSPTVDVHAHILIPEVEALVADLPGLAEARALDARRNGPAALAVSGPMVRERVPRLTDVRLRLAAMDAQGVDVQLVSPSPSHYHYWADEETAEKLYRLAGEATAAHCAQAPDRLRGLGLAPSSIRSRPYRPSNTPWTRVFWVSRSPVTRRAASCPTLRTNPSGSGPRRRARSSSCTPSAARSTSAWTSGTCPTPSDSPPRTPSPCPI